MPQFNDYYAAFKRADEKQAYISPIRSERVALYHVIVKTAALYPVSHNPKKVKERRWFTQHAILFMGNLTFNELLQLFPVEKRYDGHKTGNTDYHDTLRALKQYQSTHKLTSNDPLGSNCLALLSHYNNAHIRAVINKFTLLLLHTKPEHLSPFFSEAVAAQAAPPRNTRLKNAIAAKMFARKRSIQ